MPRARSADHLGGMTLCAWCKRQIASLVGGRRSAAVSHGMCRRCLEERIARATAA